MNVAAIIAEYNPFHKGHQYHIKRTKEITGCSHLLVVMSGYYTQRGEPAIFSQQALGQEQLGKQL
ncbi:MAG: nucleotidyltransferase family protein [Lachnospiraceae bacterium]|nr:nucleotidyltransferase family protein [Lachnospiraceae bacterium]